MIAILGDIHFQSKNDYFIRTCEEFLKWFDSWSFNNKNNTIRFLNEIVKMAKQNKFSILVGNDKNTIQIIKG